MDHFIAPVPPTSSIVAAIRDKRMGNGQSGGKKLLNRNQLFKRQKVRDARTIRAEAVKVDGRKKSGRAGAASGSDHDLSESGGMLQVAGFISSRQFELRELQLAMDNSKNANSTRVFQSLPRKLRRRTASHNVKRIPKRMRNRALREMAKNDAKPEAAGKGQQFNKTRKMHGMSAAQLYRAQMSVKLLRLASKSASMRLALPQEALSSSRTIRSKIKSLRSQIKANRKNAPLKPARNNKMGSYDVCGINELASVPKSRIKFQKRQRFFAWLPSHIWNAKRSHMMKRWGFQIPWSPTQKCFRLAHRMGGNVATSDGALAMDTSFYGTMIMKSSPNSDESNGYFKNAVSQLLGKRSTLERYRTKNNWFEGYVFDIDTDIASILGPVDMLWVEYNTVLMRLHPSIYGTVFESLRRKHGDRIILQDCRFSLGSITLKGAKSLTALSSVIRTNSTTCSFEQLTALSKIADTSSLPQKTMFAFECIDPRHLASPKVVNSPSTSSPTVEDVLKLQNQFPTGEIRKVICKLISSKDREESYANQQTLKQLATRRQNLLSHLKNHCSNMIPHDQKHDPSIPILIVKRQKNDDWLVILPWFWILPFWYQLNKVSRVYHMGVRQLQQLTFENQKLYYPDDFPFTRAGYIENAVYKKETKKAKWLKKPAGKRVNFSKLPNVHKESLPSFSGEIGDYFSCDWKLLQILRNGLKYLTMDGKTLRLYNKERTTQFDEKGSRAVQVLNDVFEFYKDIVGKDEPVLNETNSLPVELAKKSSFVQRPICWKESVLASINETPLPIKPISCVCLGKGHPTDNARIYRIPKEDVEYWKRKKGHVYRADGKIDHDLVDPVPNITDLIGFITSGTYHLGEGRGVAQGFIDAEAAIELSGKDLLIRNVGATTYRLVEWDNLLM